MVLEAKAIGLWPLKQEGIEASYAVWKRRPITSPLPREVNKTRRRSGDVWRLIPDYMMEALGLQIGDTSI